MDANSTRHNARHVCTLDFFALAATPSMRRCAGKRYGIGYREESAGVPLCCAWARARRVTIQGVRLSRTVQKKDAKAVRVFKSRHRLTEAVRCAKVGAGCAAVATVRESTSHPLCSLSKSAGLR
eukprot:1410193-Amphidinium_carterae.2